MQTLHGRRSKTVRIGAAIATVLLVLTIAAALVGARMYSAHGGKTRPVRTIRGEATTRLAETVKTSSRLQDSIIGAVHYSTGNYLIHAVSYTPEGPVTHRVLLTGGVHGNEPKGVVFLLQLIERFARDGAPWPGVAFDIVLPVNPWGWEQDRRCNADGCDLNRDFASFGAQESRLMRDFITKNKYDLHIDYHQDDAASGFYLYQLDNPKPEFSRHVIERMKSQNLPVHTGRVMYLFTAQDGIIVCPRWQILLSRAIRQCSMTNWHRLHGCPQSFVAETPKSLPEETIMAMNRIVLEALMDDITK
jgi:hypothetical protein